MAYIPKNCRFGFITDTHFSVTRTDFRTDDYFESVISKFRQCYDHFNTSGCEFIIHGGDVFDKFRSYSHPMIQQIREIIVSSQIPTYFIWGQHDLLGYNRESSRNSNLEFLQKICDGKLIEIKDCVDVGKVRIFASHVDQDPITVLSGINPRLMKPSIAVVHALLYNEDSIGTICIKKFPAISPILVLSGDLHCGYEATKIGDTVFYNPGSLARTSKEKRKPKVSVIDLIPVLTDWMVDIKEFFPQCNEYPFKEETEEVKTPEKQDSEEYIEAFEKFKSETKDILECLEKVGKVHNISEEVLTYIKSMRSK